MDTQSTDITIIAKQAGLEVSDIETINQSYQPFFEEIAKISEEALKINFENPTPTDELIARNLRLRMVKVRTGALKVKDERKRIHLLRGNFEQAKGNLIESGCKLEEEKFLQVEKKRELAEAARIENLKKEREEILCKYVDNASIYPLGTITEEAFNDLINGLKLAKEAKEKQEQEAELQRIETARLEAERLEAQRIENERLKKEAEDREAEIKKEREEAAKLQKEQELKAQQEREEAAKAQRLIEEKAKAEKAKADELLREEKAKAAKLQKEIDDKKAADEKKEREEFAAKEKLRLEKEAAEKKAAKAPKKQKLNLWVSEMNITTPVGLETDGTVIEIIEKFNAFKNWATKQIETI